MKNEEINTRIEELNKKMNFLQASLDSFVKLYIAHSPAKTSKALHSVYKRHRDELFEQLESLRK